MTARRSRVGAVEGGRAVRLLRSTGGPAQRAWLLLLVLVLSLLPMAGTLAHAQTPSPAASASAGTALPMTVTVTRLSPTAPQPGDQLSVGGILSNTTAVAYDDLRVSLRIAPTPLTSRAALLAVASSTAHIPSDDVTDPISLGAVPAGGQVPYLFQLPIDALNLVQTGVYQLSVEVFAGGGDDRAYQARVNTFLPWLPPSASISPVHVAWLWPLLSTPHLLPSGTLDSDELGSELQPRGRLGLLVDVATQAVNQSGTVPEQTAPSVGLTDPPPTPRQVKPVPVTPVVDPENYEELSLMADTDYTVKGVPGTYRAAAGAYRQQLRDLMTKVGSSIATPYGDPDLESLAQAGATTVVTQARSTGLESQLPSVVPGLLWPPDGALSQSTLEQLTTSGLVLSSKAVPVTDGSALGYTPTAATEVERPGGTVPAVVIDDGLSRLATKPVKAADRVLLTQRFAAETAAIAVESAPGPRVLVLSPGRRWSPSQSPVRAMLAETGRLPWLQPETVPAALAEQPDPAVSRGPLRETAAAALLPQQTASRIAQANTELARFRSILCPVTSTGSSTPTPTVAPTPTASAAPGTLQCSRDDQVLNLQRSLYRATSTAFRLPQAGGAELLGATVDELRTDEAKVKILSQGSVVLVGSRARIPVSVANGLSVPVKVQLVLRPKSQGLTTGRPVTLTLEPGATVQQDITVTSRKAGGGVLGVQAQLLTPSGADFGPASTLRVRVSAAGVVVVTITIAVCSLLGLAVLVRIYRRLRARRPAPQPQPEPQQ